jgi:hypothetical protein
LDVINRDFLKVILEYLRIAVRIGCVDVLDKPLRFLYFHFSNYFSRRYLRGPKRGLPELFLYKEEFSDLYLMVLTTLCAAGCMRGIICYVCPSKRYKRLHAIMAHRMFWR